jgi:hypothetical protein
MACDLPLDLDLARNYEQGLLFVLLLVLVLVRVLEHPKLSLIEKQDIIFEDEDFGRARERGR